MKTLTLTDKEAKELWIALDCYIEREDESIDDMMNAFISVAKQGATKEQLDSALEEIVIAQKGLETICEIKAQLDKK